MADCLVIIDVQNGFLCHPSTLQISSKIRQLVQVHRFDHIVCTQFCNKNNSPFERFLNWHELKDQNSQTVHPEILAISEQVFPKSGYSCFTPELEQFQKENQIDQFVFAGVDTEGCVLQSAVDCFERNIPGKVFFPCCASNGGPDAHQAGILVIERLIGSGNLIW